MKSERVVGKVGKLKRRNSKYFQKSRISEIKSSKLKLHKPEVALTGSSFDLTGSPKLRQDQVLNSFEFVSNIFISKMNRVLVFNPKLLGQAWKWSPCNWARYRWLENKRWFEFIFLKIQYSVEQKELRTWYFWQNPRINHFWQRIVSPKYLRNTCTNSIWWIHQDSISFKQL